MNHFEHSIHPLQNVCIPKAKDSEASAPEELRASNIRVLPLGVLTAVELDYEPTLHTTEIGDVRWNRVLPAKLGASALPVA